MGLKHILVVKRHKTKDNTNCMIFWKFKPDNMIILRMSRLLPSTTFKMLQETRFLLIASAINLDVKTHFQI